MISVENSNSVGIRAYARVCMFVHICTLVIVHAFTDAQIHHVQIHTRTHTHSQTYTHTQTHHKHTHTPHKHTHFNPT